MIVPFRPPGKPARTPKKRMGKCKMARQAGWNITISLFIPVDQTSTRDTISKSMAVERAEAGDIMAIADLAAEEFTVFRKSFTSRNDGTGRAADKATPDDGDDSDKGGDAPAPGVSALPFRRAAKNRQAVRH